MSEDDKHYAALNSVTPEIAANEFLHCQVPRGAFVTETQKREILEVAIAIRVFKNFKSRR